MPNIFRSMYELALGLPMHSHFEGVQARESAHFDAMVSRIGDIASNGANVVTFPTQQIDTLSDDTPISVAN